jgi:Xaa-Pro aminopeptidase
LITKKEFAARRRAFMSLMRQKSIAILPSAQEHIRKSDTQFKFCQNSDLHYLSGFPEPESVVVLIPNRPEGEFVLFCRERDRAREIWDGYRCGPEQANERFNTDDAFPIGDIDDILPGLIEGRERVYYSMGRHPDFDSQMLDWLRTIRSHVKIGATPPNEFVDLNHLLHDLRLFKSKAEIKLMQASGKISAQAHIKAMQICKPGMYEYQLEATIVHHFLMNGAQAPAYNSIVGGGANGCILHYVENDAVLRNGDLVLIDAGCEFNGYAADITRTFPVNGTFTNEQKAIYQIVLDAQKAAIDISVPGTRWNEPFDLTKRIITQGLVDLGLLLGDIDELIEAEAYKEFYMHTAGHWIGLDVHDVGDYKVGGEPRVLEPGMALTVEPGIYIAPDNLKVDAKWRGIGIRIEDDIVVTKTGNINLTKSVPKEIDEIEALMAS